MRTSSTGVNNDTSAVGPQFSRIATRQVSLKMALGVGCRMVECSQCIVTVPADIVAYCSLRSELQVVQHQGTEQMRPRTVPSRVHIQLRNYEL